MKVQLYQDAAGEWRWRVKAANNRILAESGEGYTRRSSGLKAAWRFGIRNRLRLPDFSADSQDKAALYLISNRGALEDVMHGRLQTAIAKCRAEWASLPGAGYGQPERRISALSAAYTAAGGVLA